MQSGALRCIKYLKFQERRGEAPSVVLEQRGRRPLCHPSYRTKRMLEKHSFPIGERALRGPFLVVKQKAQRAFFVATITRNIRPKGPNALVEQRAQRALCVPSSVVERRPEGPSVP